MSTRMIQDTSITLFLLQLHRQPWRSTSTTTKTDNGNTALISLYSNSARRSPGRAKPSHDFQAETKQANHSPLASLPLDLGVHGALALVLVGVPRGEGPSPPEGGCHCPLPLLVKLLCQQRIVFILSILRRVIIFVASWFWSLGILDAISSWICRFVLAAGTCACCMLQGRAAEVKQYPLKSLSSQSDEYTNLFRNGLRFVWTHHD